MEDRIRLSEINIGITTNIIYSTIMLFLETFVVNPLLILEKSLNI